MVNDDDVSKWYLKVHVLWYLVTRKSATDVTQSYMVRDDKMSAWLIFKSRKILQPDWCVLEEKFRKSRVFWFLFFVLFCLQPHHRRF